MAVGVSVLPVLTSLYFVMIGLPPGTTLTHTLLPSTTLFRSAGHPLLRAGYPGGGLRAYRPRQGPHAARRPLAARGAQRAHRSEEHTSEPKSLMRISYAVFCLKKQNRNKRNTADAHQKHLAVPYRTAQPSVHINK